MLAREEALYMEGKNTYNRAFDNVLHEKVRTSKSNRGFWFYLGNVVKYISKVWRIR